MGKYMEGIMGSFTGKVGPVIGSSWKGISYMRGRGKKTTRQPSEMQVAQRAKFARAIEFLKPAMQLLTLGFMGIDNQRSGYNVALGRLLDERKGAITGSYPDFVIDYTKVQISEGVLAPADNVALSSAAPGEVTLEWGPSAGNALAKATHRAMVLLFEETQSRYLVSTSGAVRGDYSQTFTVSEYAGKKVHAWIAFVSEDGKKVASSVYAGRLDVS